MLKKSNNPYWAFSRIFRTLLFVFQENTEGIKHKLIFTLRLVCFKGLHTLNGKHTLFSVSKKDITVARYNKIWTKKHVHIVWFPFITRWRHWVESVVLLLPLSSATPTLSDYSSEQTAPADSLAPWWLNLKNDAHLQVTQFLSMWFAKYSLIDTKQKRTLWAAFVFHLACVALQISPEPLKKHVLFWLKGLLSSQWHSSFQPELKLNPVKWCNF